MRTHLVIPCYNEEQRLPVRVFESAACRYPDLHFVFVNDGSADATAQVLEGLRLRMAGRCSVLALERNMGKAEAVRRGLLQALAESPDFLGYWDADCATPLDELPRFLACFKELPQTILVMGSRVKMLGSRITRHEFRHYAGRVFATCASITMGLPAYDTQCGAKLFRAVPWLKAILEQPMLSRWLVDIELLYRLEAALAARGGPCLEQAVQELPLGAWRDVSQSKVGPLDFFISLMHLAKLRKRYGTCRPCKESAP